MAKAMKKYKTYWLDEEGNFTLLETGEVAFGTMVT